MTSQWLQNKLFVVGGQLGNSAEVVGVNEYYNPSSFQWKQGAPMRVPRANAGSIGDPFQLL